MRERSRDIDRLLHIREAINSINTYLNGRTMGTMYKDPMCYHAVVYNIMIIGEAANMLTQEFRAEHPATPWRDIIDMRNVLVHGYYTTSPIFIWETYTNNLPPLLAQIEQYIQNEKQETMIP